MKKYIFYAFTALFSALIILTLVYLRSEDLKRRLQAILINTVQEYTTGSATVGELSVNPVFFSIEIKKLKVIDSSGALIAQVKRSRLYISPFDLIKRKLLIRRAVIYGLSVGKDVKEIIPYLKGQKRQPSGSKGKAKSKWSFEIREVSIRDASGFVTLGKKKLKLSGLYVDSDLLRGRIRLKKGRYLYSNTKGAIRASLTLRNGKIKIRDLYLNDQEKSQLQFKGTLDRGIKGDISAKINLKSLSKIIDYKQKGQGYLKAEGNLRLESFKIRSLRELFKNLYVSLKLKGSINVQDLIHIVGEKEPIYGRAEFSGTLSGLLSSPVLKLRVKEGRGSLYGVKVNSVLCDLTFRNGRMLFGNSIVNAYGGQARVDVQFLLPVRWFQVKVVAEGLNAKDIMRLIRWDPGLPEGKLWGTLYFSGRRFVPSGYFLYKSNSIEGQIKNPLKGIREAKGYFRKFGDTLFLEGLSVKGDKTEATASGVLNLKDRTIHLNADLKTDSLREVFLREDTDGKAHMRATVDGRLDRLVVKGDVEVRDARFLGVLLGDARGRISYDIHSIRFIDWSGRFDEGLYTLNGLIHTGSDRPFEVKRPYFNLSLKTDRLYPVRFKRFIEVPAQLKGHINGRFNVRGYPENLNIKARLIVTDMDYRGFGPAEVRAALRASGSTVVLSDLKIKKGKSTIWGSVEINRDRFKKGRLRFSVWTDDLPERYRVLRGIVSKGEIVLSGKLKRPLLKIHSGVFIKKKKDKALLDAGRIEMIYRGEDTVDATVNLFEGISLDFTASLKGGLSWRAGFNVKDSKYEEYLRLLFARLPEDFTFSLNGKGRLWGNAEEINGDIRLRRVQLSLYEQNIVSHGPVEIKIKNSRFIIQSMQLKAGTSLTTLTGEVDLKNGYDLTAYGTLYLSPLQPFLKRINYLTGSADFVIGVSGDIDSPELSGDITIKNSSLSISGIPGRLYNLKGYMYFYKNRIVLEELKGRYGDGRLSLKGAANLKAKRALSLEKLNADLTLKEIELRPFKGLELSVSGNVSVSENEGGYSVVGDMRIIKGLLNRDINWRALVLKRLREGAKPVTVKRVSKINLNIALYGDRDIRIKTNIVEGEAVVDVVVVGTPQKPSLLGRVELKQGKLFFRNNEFTIRHASADFIKPESIYPYFNVNAETRLRDYNITLVLDGYVDEFDLSLVSNPPLDEVDILSLLMLGRLSGELKGMEGGISASEATAFLTGEFQQTIQERIKNLTGFDRVEVEPFISEATGSIAPRLTVSKRLLGDRFYLIYSTLLGDTTEQLIKVEMKVSDSVSLIGERDETGGVGADIRFRVRFK